MYATHYTKVYTITDDVIYKPSPFIKFYLMININKKQIYFNLLDQFRKLKLTISIGSVLAHHKIYKKKFKKSVKAHILLLNVLQIILKKFVREDFYIINLIGINYKLNKLMLLFDKTLYIKNLIYMYIEPKQKFSPLKTKKIKSIKKRLKKKLLLDLKKNNK